MPQLINEIKNRVNSEERAPGVLYDEVKKIGMYMYVTNTLTKDQVITICSNLIKLYETLNNKDNDKHS